MRRSIPVLTLVLAAAALAQNGAQFDDWRPDAAAGKKLTPKVSCTDLRRETSYDFTVATATLVPREGGVPEHCRVFGQILPEIRFEVDLPSVWNRRMYMQAMADSPANHSTARVASSLAARRSAMGSPLQ